jgi:radical SAM superfamily enzyme YgiQ (UPF0313 family)
MKPSSTAGNFSTLGNYNLAVPQPHSDETFLYTVDCPKVADAIPVAWCYPASYAITMASLGYLLLFALLDKHPKALPVRFATEDYGKGYQLRQYPLMGFSFSFELDILEILRCFQAEDFPLYAKERHGDTFPLVFAGGPVPTTNPEPYAPFFDFFLIGEGEELLGNLMDAYHRNQHLRHNKPALLEALATEVQGVYVPSFVAVEYEHPTGAIAGMQSILPNLPFPTQKQWLTSLENSIASSPILSDASVFGRSFLVEVMRGCSHRCRFCLASYSTLPTRSPQVGALLETINHGLKYTNKIGLLGVLVADHPEFPHLCDALAELPDVQISSGAVRADTLTAKMCQTLADSGSQSITLAIETGSPWLRRRINKHLKEEAIFTALERAAEAGLKSVKLYHMVGLPDETDAHIQESIDLIRRLKKATPKLKLSVGCSTFVPKAWTPFQWMERPTEGILKKRMEQFRKGVIQVADFRPSSTKWDMFQAMVSRGDRRLAPFLERFTQLGGSHGHINRALKALKQEKVVDFPSVAWYGERQRPEAEVLPWETVFLGVEKAILWKEGLIPDALSSTLAQSALGH